MTENSKMEMYYHGDEEKKPLLLQIKNFYNQYELEDIWTELNFLTTYEKIFDPDTSKTASAMLDGQTKKNKSLFLASVYKDLKYSNIYKTTKKVFNDSFLQKLISINPIYRGMREDSMENHQILISYYENGDNYFAHRDLTRFTILTYLFKEPKKFTGGELLLNDFDMKIEVENNMVLIIPGAYLHEVLTTKMEKNVLGNGRYCISQFVS